MGPWALEQAKAFQREGLEIEVVSPTSFIPAWLGRAGVLKSWALCPLRHDWQGLTVHYPRFFYYCTGRVKQWCYRNPGIQMSWAWASIRGWLRDKVQIFQPDVILTNHALPAGYLAYKLWQEFKIPYLLTEHDYDEVDDCAVLEKRKAFFLPVYQNAKRVIAVSKRMEDSLQRIFDGVKTQTVYNGIHLEAFSARPSGKRASESFKKEEIVVLSAGTFYARKRFDLLIRAFAEAVNVHPQLRLRIAGDGEKRPEIEHLIRAKKLQDKVRLLGYLDQDALFDEMGRADLFALAGEREPFGVVYAEAMAAGLPIIWTEDGGMSEMAISGIHGESVKPGSAEDLARAIAALAGDAKGRREKGRNAQELVRSKLTWDKNVAALLQICSE